MTCSWESSIAPRADELQESFNKLGRDGYKEAAGEATSTREQETPLHTSGGFVVTAASSLG